MTDITIVNRRQVLQGHAFNVEKVRLLLPDNRERDYDLVDHNDAVTILPIDDEGMVYFVRQYRVGAEKELLELPAGVMDEGEAPLTTAHRGLQEEIGRDSSVMERIGGFYMAPGYTTEYMHIFLATNLRESLLEHDEDEFLNLIKVDLREVFDMIRSGQIEDGKTISAFLLAMPMLNELLMAAYGFEEN
jgi:ADP-ribose pyrophosphatase